MPRRHPRLLPVSATLVLLIDLAMTGPVAGAIQPQPIIYRGARVRISWTTPPDWIHGVVEQPMSTDLQLVVNEGEDVRRIIIDDATQLQLYLGRKSRGALAAGIGAVGGAIIGGTVMSDPFGTDGSTFARTQGAFAGAVTGAGTGLLISFVAFGTAEWESVPVRNGTVVFPPLDQSDGLTGASLHARYPWQRFSPHEAAFAAFFEEYWTRLDPIEGIFVRHDGQGRIAIVRDVMFDDYRYVVVNLEPPVTLREVALGDIVAAIRPGRSVDQYEMQFTGDVAAGPQRGRLVGTELVIQERTNTIMRWIRQEPHREESEIPGREPARDHHEPTQGMGR